VSEVEENVVDQAAVEAATGDDDSDRKDDSQLWDELEAAETAEEAEPAEPTEPHPPSPDEAASPSGETVEKVDLFADATDEQRAAWDAAQSQLEKLEQSDRSNRGRLGAMQRQINALTKQAAADDAAAKQGQPPTDNSYLNSDEYKEFADEYPEVAGPMSKILEGYEQRLKSVDERLSADQRESVVEEQTEVLTQYHPNWQSVLAANGNEFAEWVNTQPRHIQEAAYRNAEEIVDAEEAADVVSRFEAFRSDNGVGDSSADGSAPKNGADSANPRLTDRRRRQLETAAGARGSGPGIASGIPEDGDEQFLWDAFDKLERQEERRA
jgi:hypothetical protein